MDLQEESKENHEADQSGSSSNDVSTESLPLAATRASGNTNQEAPKKKKKKGIVYVSSIPKYMTVSILREFMGRYAAIGRIYLQAANISENQKKRKMRRHFTEGWIEFESKRAARQTASLLNGTVIAKRKSSKFCDILWCLKYLPSFKWTHLSERLTYEKAVYKQRLRAEVSQARKETSFFQDNLDRSERNKKKVKKKPPNE